MDILLEKFGLHNSEVTNEGKIHAQIPGLINQIFVQEGDIVEKKQKLFILEAMKMENEINSPVKGKVEYIACKVGDKIEKGDLIMEIIT